MIRSATRFIRRFRKEEDGQVLVEFVLAIPLIFTLFLTSVEMGIYALRQSFLDRGLDMTIREIRLGTGNGFTHSQLKDRICQFSGFLPDCDTALRLEIRVVNPRNFQGFGQSADCIDAAQVPTPPPQPASGFEHDLMLMRVCYKFNPVFPTTGLGYAYDKDGAGQVKMVSMSGFVQEPN
jgi:TadE-like protein